MSLTLGEFSKMVCRMMGLGLELGQLEHGHRLAWIQRVGTGQYPHKSHQPEIIILFSIMNQIIWNIKQVNPS